MIFLTNGAETTGYLHTRKWYWTHTSHHTKTGSKWITDLNIDLNKYILTPKFKDGSSWEKSINIITNFKSTKKEKMITSTYAGISFSW